MILLTRLVGGFPENKGDPSASLSSWRLMQTSVPQGCYQSQHTGSTQSAFDGSFTAHPLPFAQDSLTEGTPTNPVFSNHLTFTQTPREQHPKPFLRFHCHICDRAFSFRDHYQGHMNSHNKGVPGAWAFDGSLPQHASSSSSSSPNRPLARTPQSQHSPGQQYGASPYFNTFAAAPLVSDSESAPPSRYKCQWCGAQFKTAHGFKGHVRKNHSNDPNFRCGLCGKGFLMKGHYEGHMNMHNNVKAFHCPGCPRRFAYKSSLNAHVKFCRPQGFLKEKRWEGDYPPESHDSSACDQKLLEATQLFKEWLSGQSVTEDQIKGMTVQQLDKLLASFYREVRKRDGSPLKEHALRRVRSGLMKYLSKLLNLQYPITTLDFQRSNKVYTEMLSKMPSKPTVMLSRGDCTLIRSHKALSIDSPTSLLKKVWFELQLHFGARRWSPREMWPEAFVFVTTNDDDDTEYVMLDSEQLVESHLKPEVKDMLMRRQMFSTGGNLCPVEALKLYLSKRELSAARPGEKVPFLQKPNPLWTATNGLAWYSCTEISLGKNHNFIRELAEEVKLEAGYTNMSLCFGDPRQYFDCWP
ncbi:hypothetical protein ACOMHN_023001 [Nucella lapillus]